MKFAKFLNTRLKTWALNMAAKEIKRREDAGWTSYDYTREYNFRIFFFIFCTIMGILLGALLSLQL